jgi:hypothetical protein
MLIEAALQGRREQSAGARPSVFYSTIINNTNQDTWNYSESAKNFGDVNGAFLTSIVSDNA